jgi:hypothetical protein
MGVEEDSLGKHIYKTFGDFFPLSLSKFFQNFQVLCQALLKFFLL